MTDKQENIDQIDNSDAPYACEELMEEYILLENELGSEPEEEQEDVTSRKKQDDVELRFARYERNFRSRRIRELTLTPFTKKGTRGRPRKIKV